MSNLRTMRNSDSAEASQSLQNDAHEGIYASEIKKSETAVTGNEEEEEEEEDYGPKLPSGAVTKGVTSGPTIPKLDDLELQRGMCINNSHIFNLLCLMFWKRTSPT